jgi:hypothetical protein
MLSWRRGLRVSITPVAHVPGFRGQILEFDTIIGVPLEAHHPLHSMLHDRPEPEAPEASTEFSGRLVKIRSADTSGRRSSAGVLINRMYATRGYRSNGLPTVREPTRITLMASEHDETVGTITIGFDSEKRLHVDDLFADEVDALRRRGRRVCEFTKLAMDSVVRSKRVLAALFHVSYIYGHRLMGYDELLIEVNPRHVRYYERMLGFRTLGPPRLNRRVDAPAVLMALDFAHAHDQIDRFGGMPQYSLLERSLYPYFFSVGEEAGIVGRLRAAEAPLVDTLGPRRADRVHAQRRM